MSKFVKPQLGVLNIYKSARITSHDVVDQVRKLTGARRVGHGGTLDPFATGVLLVAVGSATRLLEYVKDLPKTYEATFVLGAVSDTDDVTGEIKKLRNKEIKTGTSAERHPGPDPGSTLSAQPLLSSPYHGRNDTSPDRDEVEVVLHSFIGTIEQVPPMYSAVKVKGKKLYEYARAGKDVNRKSRTVTIHDIQIKRYKYPELELTIMCGSGTYIRSLARDLGETLGTGAYVSKLCRTAIGHFTIEKSVKLEDLNANNISDHLLSPNTLVGHMPSITLSNTDEKKIRHGVAIHAPLIRGVRGVQERGSRISLRSSGMTTPSRGKAIALFNQSHEIIGIGKINSSKNILHPKKIL